MRLAAAPNLDATTFLIQWLRQVNMSTFTAMNKQSMLNVRHLLAGLCITRAEDLSQFDLRSRAGAVLPTGCPQSHPGS